MNAAQNAREQRNAVTDCEQANVENNVLDPVKKEDDPDEESQVIITGHHVLRAQINERGNRGALIRLNKASISLGDVMRASGAGDQQPGDYQDDGNGQLIAA